jgi:DNA-binding protein HU-beta
MTKADIVTQISKKLGIEKIVAYTIIESTMVSIQNSLGKNENVYLRGFGSFVVKKRAQKTARNISKNISIIIPAHNIPAFKPVKAFLYSVKTKVK